MHRARGPRTLIRQSRPNRCSTRIALTAGSGLVAISMLLSACGGAASSSLSAGQQAPQSHSPTPLSSASSAEPAGTLAVICVLGDNGWETVDPNVASPQTPGKLTPAGDCGRFDIGTVAANNPPTAEIYKLSPNLRYWAEWQALADGNQDAGYIPTSELDNSSAWVETSGNKGGTFSDNTVTDSQVIFNPATGDLWWERNGDMFSAAAPGGKPVDHGRGYLYSFTPSGDPVPFPYFDSPSGTRRLVFDPSGQGEAPNAIGPVSALTPTCLQQAGVEASTRQLVRDCPGAASANQVPGGLAGFINDTTIVGWTSAGPGGSVFEAFTITPSGPLRVTHTRQLTPPTQQNIVDGLVTPDGKKLLFFAGDQSGLHLYSVPTDDNSQADPTLIAQWPAAGDYQAALVGWRLANGTFAP